LKIFVAFYLVFSPAFFPIFFPVISYVFKVLIYGKSILLLLLKNLELIAPKKAVKLNLELEDSRELFLFYLQKWEILHNNWE